MLAGVGALEKGELVFGEEGAGVLEGEEEVLGANEGVRVAEAVDLGADERAVLGVVSGAV